MDIVEFYFMTARMQSRSSSSNGPNTLTEANNYTDLILISIRKLQPDVLVFW